MILIKNGTNAISILYTGSHKSFLILLVKCLKCTLTYLYCINYNEINICISNIEKLVPIKNGMKKCMRTQKIVGQSAITQIPLNIRLLF